MPERIYKTLNFAYPGNIPNGKTLLTGIRPDKHSNNKFYITGFYNSPLGGPVLSYIYRGKLNDFGKSYQNTWNLLSYPSSDGKNVSATNLYGPNSGPSKKIIRAVGNYTLEGAEKTPYGCLYEGPLTPTDENPGQWRTLIPNIEGGDKTVLNVIAHSTIGDFVVGNYDTLLIQGKAFLYSISKDQYWEIIQDNAKSMTAYGIWQNSKNSYTICGGYTDLTLPNFEKAYLLDWDSKLQKFSNFRTYTYNNSQDTKITHFNGIYGDQKGYTCTGDTENGGFIFRLPFKNKVSSKGSKGFWEPLAFPGSKSTSGNSVVKSTVIGVTIDSNGKTNGYVSTVIC